jgi:hypothetical protein
MPFPSRREHSTLSCLLAAFNNHMNPPLCLLLQSTHRVSVFPSQTNRVRPGGSVMWRDWRLKWQFKHNQHPTSTLRLTCFNCVIMSQFMSTWTVRTKWSVHCHLNSLDDIVHELLVKWSDISISFFNYLMWLKVSVVKLVGLMLQPLDSWFQLSDIWCRPVIPFRNWGSLDFNFWTQELFGFQPLQTWCGLFTPFGYTFELMLKLWDTWGGLLIILGNMVWSCDNCRNQNWIVFDLV